MNELDLQARVEQNQKLTPHISHVFLDRGDTLRPSENEQEKELIIFLIHPVCSHNARGIFIRTCVGLWCRFLFFLFLMPSLQDQLC